VTTPLARHLVFNVHTSGPGTLEGTDSPGDAESATETRIGIHQQGEVAGLDNAFNIGQDIIERRNSKIGQAQ
jgi:hypothetical protein